MQGSKRSVKHKLQNQFNNLDMNQDIEPPNIYQIPQCTICLRQLSNDMHSLGCGHIYHFVCISQHFEYKKTCPNCQKHATNKQLRPIIYPLTSLGTKSDQYLNKVLHKFSIAQTIQFESLVKQIKDLANQRQKLTTKNKKLEQQLLKLVQNSKKYQQLYQKYQTQLEISKKQNVRINKFCNQLQFDLDQLNRQIMKISIRLDQYKKQQGQYQQLNKLKKLMNKSSQDLLKYKNQLESSQTTSQEIAKIFFQMVLLFRLELSRNKQKSSDYPKIISQKERQNDRLKDTIQKYRYQLKQQRQNKFKDRKKYQDLKIKYKQLIEKIKKDNINQNNNDYLELQDSQGYDSRKGQPQISIIQLPKPLLDKKILTTQSYGGFGQNMKKKLEQGNLPKMKGFLKK